MGPARDTLTAMAEVLRVDASKPDARAILRAADVLRSGGLVAFPTETVYGLGGLALNEASLARIFAAKGRPLTHPLIAHVLDMAQAQTLTTLVTPSAKRLAAAFWPGPLTLVCDRAEHVPALLTGGSPSVAIRAPAHPIARALLAAVAEPIAAPSANRYQSISPTAAVHVQNALGNMVDLILDGGSCSSGIESTVVDVRSDPAQILRPGPLSLSVLQGVWSNIEPGATAAEQGHARPSPGMDARHYAPRASLVVVDSALAAIELAKHYLMRDNERVALLLYGHHADAMAHAVRTMPERAEDYARLLYATLHELDDAKMDLVIVQAVPHTDEWEGVRDRLHRASAPISSLD